MLQHVWQAKRNLLLCSLDRNIIQLWAVHWYTHNVQAVTSVNQSLTWSAQKLFTLHNNTCHWMIDLANSFGLHGLVCCWSQSTVIAHPSLITVSTGWQHLLMFLTIYLCISKVTIVSLIQIQDHWSQLPWFTIKVFKFDQFTIFLVTV